MTAPTAVRFTYQDYRNLPEESRYDIVDGDLQMSPSPTTVHQRIVLRLAEILSAWARSSGAGEVFVAPCDVILSETDVVQPDVLFVSRERGPIVQEKGVFGAPDLIAEILSPATAERDRTVKAKLYARAGVRELWLVDPASRTIEVLTAAPSGFLPAAIFRDADRVRSAVVKGLDLDPGKIF
jgi:Uma2 family endonuclease